MYIITLLLGTARTDESWWSQRAPNDDWPSVGRLSALAGRRSGAAFIAHSRPSSERSPFPFTPRAVYAIRLFVHTFEPTTSGQGLITDHMHTNHENLTTTVGPKRNRADTAYKNPNCPDASPDAVNRSAHKTHHFGFGGAGLAGRSTGRLSVRVATATTITFNFTKKLSRIWLGTRTCQRVDYGIKGPQFLVLKTVHTI